jgi:hypothetical protein
MWRVLSLSGAAAVVMVGGIALGGTPANALSAAPEVRSGSQSQVAAACTAAAPKPKAESQIGKCGLSHWAHSYKSNKVVGKKRCYYFLTTAWNACATPSQYNSSACKAI